MICHPERSELFAKRTTHVVEGDSYLHVPAYTAR
jgi:hypothetical protein